MTYSYETPTAHRGGHDASDEHRVHDVVGNQVTSIPLLEEFLPIPRASLPNPYPLPNGWGVRIGPGAVATTGHDPQEALDQALAFLALYGAMTTPSVKQGWESLVARIDEAVEEFAGEGETWDDLDSTAQKAIAHIVAMRDKAATAGLKP